MAEVAEALKTESLTNEGKLLLSALFDFSFQNDGAMANWVIRIEKDPTCFPTWGTYFHVVSGQLLDHKNLMRLLMASFREGYHVDVNTTPVGDFSMILSPAKLDITQLSKLSKSSKRHLEREKPILFSTKPSFKDQGFVYNFF